MNTVLLKALCFIQNFRAILVFLGRHGDAEFNTVGKRFWVLTCQLTEAFLTGICMSALCLHGFHLGALISSQRPANEVNWLF